MPSKWTKPLLLVVLLAMPAGLYLFLQRFGENQFNIPTLYEDGVSNPLSGCNNKEGPHFVNHFISQESCELWQCTSFDRKIMVFSFITPDCSTNQMEELARVCNIFRDQSNFHAITISLSPDGPNAEEFKEMQWYGANSVWSWWPYHPDVKELVRCGMNLELNCSTVEQLILLDPQYQIRGSYSTKSQETDRLITEIQVLLMELKDRTDEQVL